MLRIRGVGVSTQIMLRDLVTSLSRRSNVTTIAAAPQWSARKFTIADISARPAARCLRPFQFTGNTDVHPQMIACARRFLHAKPSKGVDHVHINIGSLAAASSSRIRCFISGCNMRCRMLPTISTAFYYGSYHPSSRCIHARGKEPGSAKSNNSSSEEKKQDEHKNKDTRTSNSGRRPRKKNQSFADHIRGLKEDYVKFPDIYSSANAINFIIFTIFCLCSTGSNTEEKWWLEEWGLDNSFHPFAWVLHSFMTNSVFSMTFAMILLHTLFHTVLPTLGPRWLLIYTGATAFLSGVIMWIGNRLYYGTAKPAEKQFGPWDITAALFVMQYLYYGVTPISILNGFNGWIRYAMWVGQICILYFDWQPTLAGTVVGLALCKGVPRFRVAKTMGAP